MGVYDLGGRQMVQIDERTAIAGRQTRSWDGRDKRGRPVAPGVYILRVTVEGDALTRSEYRLISVAY